MVKYPGLPDVPNGMDNPYTWNQPGVQQIFERWRAIADSYGRDIPLIGEVWLAPAETTEYIRPGRLNQVFYFDLMRQPWSAPEMRASIEATVASVPPGGGSPAWTLNNHDVHRSVSRYGLVEREPMYTDDDNAWRTRPRGRVDVALGVRRARAAALLLLSLPGSIYLYQGEELGLPEVLDLPAAARRDPIWTRSGHREFGRDGSRVPLPWAADAPWFGFGPPDGAAPWLPQPEWYAQFAVDIEETSADSTLHLYRSALRLRPATFSGSLEWLETGDEGVLAFRRGGGVVVAVTGERSFTVPAAWGSVVLSSQPLIGRTVAPDTAAWFK
jgi:alpha-glucosidase